MTSPRQLFAGAPLDRAHNERRDSAWVAAQCSHPDAVALPLRALDVLVRDGEAGPRLAWLPLASTGDAVERAVLLGVSDGVPHFAVAWPADGAPPEGASFTELRSVATLLSEDETAIAGHARSLLSWHEGQRHCAACGSLMQAVEAGASRECTSCGKRAHPAANPAVIMLVHDGATSDAGIPGGGRALLARNRRRPAPRFSTLAGFIEQGESIEDAVRREVREEAAVEVGDVRYHSSQPWPFPGSLMIGCLARALSAEIRVDPEELAEARWFTREEVAAALASPEGSPTLVLPDRAAISRSLIEAWVRGEG